MKTESNKKAMEDADNFVNAAMNGADRKEKMDVLRENLLKVK